MALINCSECGKQISDRARACPQCGCPLESRSSVGTANASIKPADVAGGGRSAARSSESGRTTSRSSQLDRGPLANMVRRNETNEIIKHRREVDQAASASGSHGASKAGGSAFEIKDDTGYVLLRVPGDSLVGANLASQHLWKAQLQNQDLRSANLRGTDLRDADLTGADLTGAKLDEANLEGACLSGAVFGGSLTGASLNGANLTGAKLNAGVQWNGVSCRGTILARADLRKATFEWVDFDFVDLRGANLDGTIFSRCNLNSARLQGTDLSRVGAIDYGSFTNVDFDRSTKWPSPPFLVLRTLDTRGFWATAIPGMLCGAVVGVARVGAGISDFDSFWSVGITSGIIGAVVFVLARFGFRFALYLLPRFFLDRKNA